MGLCSSSASFLPGYRQEPSRGKEKLQQSKKKYGNRSWCPCRCIIPLWQSTFKPNVLQAMDDGDMELVSMAVFEPWASIRNTLCDWTYSGPSDAPGPQRPVDERAGSNILTLTAVTDPERLAPAGWTSGEGLTATRQRARANNWSQGAISVQEGSNKSLTICIACFICLLHAFLPFHVCLLCHTAVLLTSL